jgi:hypothetical protein
VRSNLLRRLERLEQRLGPSSELPAFIMIVTADWDEEIAWRPAERHWASESGPKGFRPPWQQGTTGGEDAGNLESTARQPGTALPPFVVVTWVAAQRRESLACGERIIRDWSSDGHWNFAARERITSDPADHGLRCELGGRLKDDIRELEESFERETSWHVKDNSVRSRTGK